MGKKITILILCTLLIILLTVISINNYEEQSYQDNTIYKIGDWRIDKKTLDEMDKVALKDSLGRFQVCDFDGDCVFIAKIKDG